MRAMILSALVLVACNRGTPLERAMEDWSDDYRDAMAVLRPSLEALDRGDHAPQVCGDYVKGLQNAGLTVGPAPDGDVRRNFGVAMMRLGELAQFCGRNQFGADQAIVGARKSLRLAEKVMTERYGEGGAPGMAFVAGSPSELRYEAEIKRRNAG